MSGGVTAQEIAGFYVNEPRPQRRRYKHLSAREIRWAWQIYGDPAKAVSIRALARVLQCAPRTLTMALRRTHGYDYAKIAMRRMCGGDLFIRDYHRCSIYTE